MRAMLTTFSWQELRHHPWRTAAAVLAVMLGVAQAFSVHLINASALSEFSSAVRSVSGQPDIELRAARGGFDERLYARVARHPAIAVASPVVELQALALNGEGTRRPLRVLGVDALVVASVAPELMPQPAPDTERFAVFSPDTVFVNAAAERMLAANGLVRVQSGLALHDLRVGGRVAAAGGPVAVMDIGAAQDLFERHGTITRIDLRLKPGLDRAAVIAELQLPPDVSAEVPGDAAQRASNLSRAYRVNLTVLALVALFTGAFLVFSVLSLSVARRAQQFALLGVLGLTSRERMGLVLMESALVGLVGSGLGIALGSAMAALALQLLGGDLGGGYFAGVSPSLLWDGPAALAYGLLGVVAAVAGGWWPARATRDLPLAQTLKGLGTALASGRSHLLSIALMVSGALLALLPPIGGIPLAAYVSVGMLLVGGITALPWAVKLLYDRLAPWVAHRALPLLAVERARRVRESAAVAVSGVVASLSLAVALTVMVASFRDSVTRWLDVVLPADLYLRTANAPGSADTAWFDPGMARAMGSLPGVARIGTLRSSPVLLDPARPAVTVLARALDDDHLALPLVTERLTPPPGAIAVFVSEAVVDLYRVRPGEAFAALEKAFSGKSSGNPRTFFVAGVWRDYARQNGAVVIDQRDFVAVTGDTRVNDIVIWLAPGASAAAVQQSIRALAARQGVPDELLEFSSAAGVRATSLRIFDRSFAVTYWLQAVAIAIGLFGVAANFSAQVLARRKEFGLLVHLGLTRSQVLGVVAGEGAAWTLIGSLAGLALGLAVSVILVHVVNPQSFHWTMDLAIPWLRLLGLSAALVAAGTATAWLTGRAAAAHDAVLAVKEDW